MGAFLVLCVLGLVAFVVVGAIASAVLHAFFWLVTLPFRIFFKLLAGLGGILAGLVLAPFIAVIAAIAIVVAVVGAVIAMLAPLLPVLLLGGFAWAIFRLASRKPAAPPPPPQGFWS
jgi:hypothetical protein